MTPLLANDSSSSADTLIKEPCKVHVVVVHMQVGGERGSLTADLLREFWLPKITVVNAGKKCRIPVVAVK